MGKPAIAAAATCTRRPCSRQPVNYWRLGETGDVTDAVNEVAGTTPAYSSVNLASPGRSAPTAHLRRPSSNVVLAQTVAPAGAFSSACGSTPRPPGDVLLGSQAGALGDTTRPACPPSGSRDASSAAGAVDQPTGPLRSAIAGKCVDDAARHHQHHQISCTTATQQRQNMTGTPTLDRVMTKCLDVTAPAVERTKVQLYTCNARARSPGCPTTAA